MDASRFRSSAFGRATRRPNDRYAFTYFEPTNLPRTLDLTSDTVMALSDADNALGNLEGLGRLIPEPELLVGPFLVREAVASSRIEGTKASLSDVLKAEQSVTEKSDDIDEVQRYLHAMRRGLRLIQRLPITSRLITDLHRTLLDGGRGTERQPGIIRTSPVWIGSPNDTPDTATFVPPLPELLPDLLTDWERFVNQPSRQPTLVRCALMHYQFETIHPFLDGNGRIGRLLIVLQLLAEKRLTSPLLYLSGYMETHRREYYDRLQNVRENGEIQEWIQYFCTAVQRQAEDAGERANNLVGIRERYIAQSASDRSSIAGIIPLLFVNPFVTARSVETRLNMTSQGARNLLEKAESYGWVTKFGTFGRGGRHYWAAEEILAVIDSPVSYHRDVASDDGSQHVSDDID